MNKQLVEQKSGVVYRSLVSSLYSDIQILFLAILANIVAILVTAYKVQSSALYVLTIIMIALGAVRLMWASSFRLATLHRELTNETAQMWERKFTLGAVGHALVFGAWFFIVAMHNDPATELISISVILASLIGVCCRSYPFPRLVTLQLTCVFVPVVASLVILGGYYNLLCLLLVPYMVGMRNIAMGLRQQFLNNLIQRRNAEKLAGQFDNALNSVPQGICLYNSDGVLEVANKHIVAVTGRSAKSLVGNSAVQMIDMLMHERGVSAEDCAVLLKWATVPEQDHITHVFEIGNHPKRSVKFRANRLKSGGIISTYEDITSEILAASRIDHITRFDRLTGLLNRGQFTALLDQQISMSRHGAGFAVLLVNLGNFKLVNETLGHRGGDKLLCEATSRLKDICQDAGVCARYGGDEFAIFVNGKDNADVSIALADTIVDALTKPYAIEGQTAKVGCGVGIVYSQSNRDDAETLLRQADLALSAAKQSGSNSWQVYEDGMDQALREQRELEEDLLNSLENDELEAFFQPLVAVDERRVVVCEALVRWKHSRLGYVPPYKFVPIAENVGFINEIGNWMLRQSCIACNTWPNDVSVAVNLSPIQFMIGDIVDTIKSILEETGLEPRRLELEVTESLMLDDVDSTIEKLNELKKLGVGISLDDFGTGYSSLSYMNQLPLDKVKIDRSFVTGLQADSKSLTLLKAISTMGRQLGLKVVVEGVETSEELSILLNNVPVDQIQGYLFSKPVDERAIGELLQTDAKSHQNMLAQLKHSVKSAA